MEKQRKGGKSKHKKDVLPYFAKMNSTYQKHSFKTKLEEAFKNHTEVEDGKLFNVRVLPHSGSIENLLMPLSFYLCGAKWQTLTFKVFWLRVSPGWQP